MKLIINIILIIVLSYLSGLIGIWHWDIVIIAFLVGFIVNANGWSSFLSGLIGIAVLWTVLNYLTLSASDYQPFFANVRELFKINSIDTLIFITAIMGGLVAGMSALTGSMARLAFFEPPFRKYGKRRTVSRKW